MAQNYDVIIIGAGIVGLATAMKLGERFPKLRLLILEECLKDCQCLLVGCGAQRLGNRCPHGRVRMSGKISGH